MQFDIPGMKTTGRAPESHRQADNAVFEKLLEVFDTHGRVWRMTVNILIGIFILAIVISVIAYLVIKNWWFPVSMIAGAFVVYTYCAPLAWKSFTTGVDKALKGRKEIGFMSRGGFQVYDYWLDERSGAEFPDGFKDNRFVSFVKTPQNVLDYLEGKTEVIAE